MCPSQDVSWCLVNWSLVRWVAEIVIRPRCEETFVWARWYDADRHSFLRHQPRDHGHVPGELPGSSGRSKRNQQAELGRAEPSPNMNLPLWIRHVPRWVMLATQTRWTGLAYLPLFTCTSRWFPGSVHITQSVWIKWDVRMCCAWMMFCFCSYYLQFLYAHPVVNSSHEMGEYFVTGSSQSKESRVVEVVPFLFARWKADVAWDLSIYTLPFQDDLYIDK